MPPASFLLEASARADGYLSGSRCGREKESGPHR